MLSRDRSRIFRSPFAGRIPFLASSLESRLANASGRIEFIIVVFMDWSFASGCSPPRLSTTQLPSATDRPVLLSDGDFHPTLGAYSQAHFPRPFGPKPAPNPTHPGWRLCGTLGRGVLCDLPCRGSIQRAGSASDCDRTRVTPVLSPFQQLQPGMAGVFHRGRSKVAPYEGEPT